MVGNHGCQPSFVYELRWLPTMVANHHSYTSSDGCRPWLAFGIHRLYTSSDGNRSRTSLPNIVRIYEGLVMSYNYTGVSTGSTTTSLYKIDKAAPPTDNAALICSVRFEVKEETQHLLFMCSYCTVLNTKGFPTWVTFCAPVAVVWPDTLADILTP